MFSNPNGAEAHPMGQATEQIVPVPGTKSWLFGNAAVEDRP